ncbi:MAG: ATP-binding protein [Rikenellaceae bacterium]
MNDLALHILDIMQNSISANASYISLVICEDIGADLLTIIIKDNGKGMTKEQVDKLADPFFTSRTTRKVGLGIPLFKQSAIQSGGSLDVESEVGIGTTVKAIFGYSNIDRPPLGNVANAFILMVSCNPNIRFELKYIYNGNEYIFDSFEVKDILGDMPLSDAGVIKMLTEMIEENIKELK